MDEHAGRALAGEIARAALDRKGIQVRQAAERLNMAPATLYAIFSGASRVQTSTLRAFEGFVGMPWDLLTYVARGDTAAIEEMEFEDGGLKRYVLRRLKEADPPADSNGNGGSSRRRPATRRQQDVG